jgi:hypothetical protein
LKLFAKASVLMRTFFSRIPPDDKVKVLYQYLAREASSLKEHTSKPIFAVQGVEDPLFYGLLSIISIDVQQRVESAGRLVITRSFSSGIGKGFHVFLMRSGLVSWLISSQWARLSRQVVGAVGYRSQSFNYPFADLYDFWRAYKLWRSLRNSEDISKLEIRNILVGDLVIDSYLRFRPSPRFLVKDRFVLTVLWQAHRDIRRAYVFFSKCKPKFYISSYATYIQHGVAVRVALKVGVPVYIVSSGLVFGKKLELDDYFHVADTSTYSSVFEKLDHQEEKLSMAEEQLKHRLSGGIDEATSYMRSSAYSHNNEILPNVKGAVVIFLHDFYDSPHVYDDLIFPDFWSWICFTIDTFTQAGINFYIKPHPNQISLSDHAVQLLLQQYPQLQMLSSSITNSQLVEGGMICGITAYGTVAHELAYMGVPSISCAKHPHHSFEFCRTAKNLDEYKKFLQKPTIQPLPVKEMRRQALAFYYMHNIYCGEDNIALRRQFNTWLREVHHVDGVKLLEELVKFRELTAYRQFIIELANEISICSELR